MITRIHGASSTLAANPKRKRRNPGTAADAAAAPRRRRKPKTAAAKAATVQPAAKPATAKRSSSKTKSKAVRVANVYRTTRKSTSKSGKTRKYSALSLVRYKAPKPPKRGKRSPSFSIWRVGKGKNRRYQLRKNPGLVMAGVPVIEMAIGSVAAIAIGHASAKLISKYAPSGLPDFLSNPTTGVVGEVATAAAAWFGYHKMKNPMIREISKWAFVGAVFQAISKLSQAPIQGAIDSALGTSSAPSLPAAKVGGMYFDPYSGQPSVGGGYLPVAGVGAVDGMYTNVDDMSGLGLYQAPSIYG